VVLGAELFAPTTRIVVIAVGIVLTVVCGFGVVWSWRRKRSAPPDDARRRFLVTALYYGTGFVGVFAASITFAAIINTRDHGGGGDGGGGDGGDGGGGGNSGDGGDGGGDGGGGDGGD
jgi:hypothetical protein